MVSRIKAKAERTGLDIAKYVAMLDTTAAALIDENPGLGPDYPIWVLPSRPYPEMYVRDSFWTLAGYDKKPEVVAQLQQQRSSIVLRGYFNDAVVGRSKPGDAAIAKYYADHQADYTTPERVAWRHILLPTQKAAIATRAEIAKGLDFEAAATK